MESSAAVSKSVAGITNQLTAQLVGIALFAGVVNGVALLAGFGPITIVVLLLGNVVVCWMLVAAVIGALDDLLELKLDDR